MIYGWEAAALQRRFEIGSHRPYRTRACIVAGYRVDYRVLRMGAGWGIRPASHFYLSVGDVSMFTLNERLLVPFNGIRKPRPLFSSPAPGGVSTPSALLGAKVGEI
jgi:hypothetical protein